LFKGTLSCIYTLKTKQHLFFSPNKIKKIKPFINQYEKGIIINATLKLTLFGETSFKIVLKK